ncbi:SDR family NAD(P)-dependent oxidoreductase [Myxococcus llanfairpwllgwyngyllgogerychwyrndrobwllllantysiliogogogochensis]|uniref:SDR family NAD(P)-dependent oxidoreductase n=1 Tax=Myxococcus llanfairpwllgwyngyllgogerychwyrndrobwllllantysiliogogogochensis TaxID=2590453 RepID=A0A540WQL1_9BACT|nr:SDR family NAD(P)-dependent oxidoreductase [Myxococcus llanfairpwllgwyngyllgogerychwyrndrobwllllantysiliogogogochensis]TQF11302.1 SDR family NAD(P)-dependent oxidoreductase [Myxococcus llanfairpwllgwyngyllgogerychwyrndrobwllllantysiliogogogochensis]
MADLILTGASRGIGHALAKALAKSTEDRLILVARDRARLDALVLSIQQDGGQALAVPGDLSSLAAARDLGRRLVAVVRPESTLVHNAGVWPSRRELTPDGLERAFVVNHAAPWVMQQALLDAGRLRRILLVSAGLLVKGRFDAARTPMGEDFSSIRTYCDTKLGFALAMRDVATEHPELDVLVMHPGVVRTDLGARTGPVGWLLSLVKRGWESPEVCAERLVRVLSRGRWSPPGQASWSMEETEHPWPAVTEDVATRRAVREVHARLFPGT